MEISKSEFLDWKASPVTKAVIEHLTYRRNILVEQLSHSAGLNKNEDNFRRGYIVGLEDLLGIDMEEEQKEINLDD